jgi:phosphoribosylformylglycinamidine synthase
LPTSGQIFEIKLNDSLKDDEARTEVERFAHDVLSNPVIEDYRVELVR